MPLAINLARKHCLHGHLLLVVDNNDNSIIGNSCLSELGGSAVKLNIHNGSAGRTKSSGGCSSDGVLKGEVAKVSKPNRVVIDGEIFNNPLSVSEAEGIG